jgi:hypothetical protein
VRCLSRPRRRSQTRQAARTDGLSSETGDQVQHMARRPPEDAKQKHLGVSGISGRDCDWVGWPGGRRFKGRQTARYATPSSAQATTKKWSELGR